VTKAQVGLGDVDDTADAAKPVSTAQAAAIATKMAKANNLSDLSDFTAARNTLGVYSKTEVIANFLGINAKAADADKLDGYDIASFPLLGAENNYSRNQFLANNKRLYGKQTDGTTNVHLIGVNAADEVIGGSASNPLKLLSNGTHTINNSAIYTAANIGKASVDNAAKLGNQLPSYYATAAALAAITEWPGVYTGSDPTFINHPVGSYIVTGRYESNARSWKLNTAVILFISMPGGVLSNNTGSYTATTGNPVYLEGGPRSAVPGTWVNRAEVGDTTHLLQRIA
jgi:hypothetical protein